MKRLTTKHTALFLATAALVAIACAPPAQAQEGDYCREYTRQVKIGGTLQEAYGVACQQPDGSWEIQPDSASPGAHSASTVPANVVVEQVNYRRDRHGPNVIIIKRPVYGYHRGYHRHHHRGPHRDYIYWVPPGHYKHGYKPGRGYGRSHHHRDPSLSFVFKF